MLGEPSRPRHELPLGRTFFLVGDVVHVAWDATSFIDSACVHVDVELQGDVALGALLWEKLLR